MKAKPKPKPGDVLIAVDPCVMYDSYKPTLTIGREYIVKSIEEDEFVIRDDMRDWHYFEFKGWWRFFKMKEWKK